MKKIVPRRDILMEKSKVYFTTMKTTLSENLPQKLKRLILAAGKGCAFFCFYCN